MERLGPIKQIRAGALDVGYCDFGDRNSPPVLLLHGWPYDINSYVDVAPMLAARGCRVIVPHLRGHGTTRFLDATTPRAGGGRRHRVLRGIGHNLPQEDPVTFADAVWELATR